MKIFDTYDEANSSWNWEVLDELTDDELYDEIKVKEKINIIHQHRLRIKNKPNKYPENIMEYVRQTCGLQRYDDSKDNEINMLSPDEVFNRVCNFKSLVGYADMIKSWIRDIYKVDLNSIEIL